VRVAYRPDAAPFSFKGANDAQPGGFMIALCSAIVAQLPQLVNRAGLTTTYVPVTSTTRFDAIRTGQADMLCDSSTMTIERRKLVDFSIPTFLDGAGLLVRDRITDFKQLAGKKIGVLAGSTTQQALNATIKDSNITADVVPVPTYTEGLRQLEAGTISAYFGDRSVLLSLAQQAKQPDQLAIADNYLTMEPYAIALPRGDEDFRLAIDTALSRIYRSGRIVDIFTNSFHQRPGPLVIAVYAATAYPD
jgi:polar amino acid transport system substrate-binding protein/glutamate/aspartate transport system substrate-binding protein